MKVKFGPDKDRLRTNLKRLKIYFRSNPGAVFIVAFQFLLISAAAFLASGDSKTADAIALYAFYALVFGIVLHGIKVVRESGKACCASR